MCIYGYICTGGLFIAASDSKHYSSLAPTRIYKHFPFKWSGADLDTIHGTDERVSIASLGVASRYFAYVLVAAALPAASLHEMAMPLYNPGIAL